MVDPKDVEDLLMAYAAEENLEAVEVAVVTEEPRLVLEWRGKEIVNISRAFLGHQRCTSGDQQLQWICLSLKDNDLKDLYTKSCRCGCERQQRQHGLQSWLI